jgi:hypothetical protein
VAPFALGEPSVRLLQGALALLFAEVVEVSRPEGTLAQRNDLAGVIELRIESASYQIPRVVGAPPSPQDAPAGVLATAQITYGLALYSRGGNRVGSWTVTGRGHTLPPDGVFWVASATESVKRSFERAMREAAWMVTSGFRDVPEVRRWLLEQGG